jgi:hypothetical protein
MRTVQAQVLSGKGENNRLCRFSMAVGERAKPLDSSAYWFAENGSVDPINGFANP